MSQRLQTSGRRDSQLKMERNYNIPTLRELISSGEERDTKQTNI